MRHALGFSLLALCACSQPVAAPPPAAPLSAGAQLFREKCGASYRAGGMASVLLARRQDGQSALLETRAPLQPDQIEQIVRNGTGNMPALSRGEISDEELAVIVDDLTR